MASLLAHPLLELIAAKRRGGEHNIKGIGYQLMYACYRLLEEFSHEQNEYTIRLEGLEDVDVNSTLDTGSELIQLKHSTSSYDAHKFWTSGAMQNFLEIYLTGAPVKFLVIHDSQLKGELLKLANGNFSEQTVSYWTAKIKSDEKFKQEFNVLDFLSKISFKQWKYQKLHDDAINLLLGKHGINAGAETRYLQALFFYVFEWSKLRASVTRNDLLTALTQITDSFSHAPKNPAIEHGWISEVCFDVPYQSIGLDDYFDGRAARPAHIGANLPVQRMRWEKKISEELNQADAVVIHASSGQGKSTLAWQTAMKLASKGYNIYQLNSCKDWNEANALRDFLKTRLRIGQVPLVVIDNLNKQHSKWPQLLELLADMPVQILVTAREEDWHRYNSDESRVRVKLIAINLNQAEARQIYTELKKRNKVASGIKGWQPAYEQIADKGLLIEYTYLLTQGQQLAHRLQQQIKELSSESDSAAKLEILRLISVADCMNIKLETEKLLTIVRQTEGMISDRGMIIAQLENEYHLQFDKKFIEGLHPVRSRHLMNILHKTIPLNSTLTSVFKILDDYYVYDYAIALPGFLGNENKAKTFECLGEILATSKPISIVYFLDGLMHAEPQIHFLRNREIYDEAYRLGGLALFVIATVPFIEPNFLEQLAESTGPSLNRNLLKLIELKNSLTNYSFEGSEIFLFTTLLAKHLKGVRLEVGKLEGLEFLMRWFQKLNIALPIALKVSEQTLLNALNTESHTEVKELFTYFRLKEPERYEQFLQAHKETIIGWLKVATSTLTIEERDGDIYLEYLLEDNVEKANEQSVSRIEMVYHFMPVYKHYNTDIVFLPFPTEELFEATRSEAHKRMTSEALHSPFNVHLNQIWARTVESNFSHLSAYHWQEEHTLRRKAAIAFCQYCAKMFESLIEGNQNKYQESVKTTFSARDAFQKLQTLAKPLQRPIKYSEKPKFTEEFKAIDNWFASVNNFTNQFTDIVLPNKNLAVSDPAHIPMVNLKETHHKLPIMQLAFQQVCASGFSYFEESNLDEEKRIVSWLLKTVQYYVTINLGKMVKSVPSARSAILNWWQKKEHEELQKVYTLIEAFQYEYGYQIIKPTYLKKEAHYNIVTIGITGFNLADAEELTNIFWGLSDFAQIKAAFIEIVFVKDGFATGAARVNQSYLQYINYLKSGLEPDPNNLKHLIPMEVTTELITPLAGVEIPEKISSPVIESFVQLVMALWRLTEYRKRLNSRNMFEQKWLKGLEEIEIGIANSSIEKLMDSDWVELQSLIEDTISGKIAPSREGFATLLIKYVQDKQRDSQ